MPEVHFAEPFLGGLLGGPDTRVDIPQGASTLVNMWVDPATEAPSPRPPVLFDRNPGTVAVDSLIRNGPGMAVVYRASALPDPRIATVEAYTQQKVDITDYSVTSGGLTFRTRTGGFSVPGRLVGDDFPWIVTLIPTGVVSFLTPAASILTSPVLFAFGRAWAGGGEGPVASPAFRGQPLVRWTDSGITTLTGAGSGSITVPGARAIHGVHELGDRLVAVAPNALYLLGSQSGGAPIDPNAAGGIAVTDVIDGAGAKCPGLSVVAGEVLYTLSDAGLAATSLGEFRSKPLASFSWADQTTASAFCRAIPEISSVLPCQAVYWAAAKCLIFADHSADRALYVYIGGKSPVFAVWEGFRMRCMVPQGQLLYGVRGAAPDLFTGDLAVLTADPVLVPQWFAQVEPAYGAIAESTFMVGGKQQTGGEVFPKQLQMGIRIGSLGPRAGVSPLALIELTQRTLEGPLSVQSRYTIAPEVPAITRPRSPGSVGPSEWSPNKTLSAALRGSGPYVRAGWRIQDARFLQVLTDKISIRFAQGSSFRPRSR